MQSVPEALEIVKQYMVEKEILLAVERLVERLTGRFRGKFRMS